MKQILFLLGCDSNSCVADPESNPVPAVSFALINVHRDSPVIRKLASVAQQIEQNLPDFRYVGVHRGQVLCHVHVNRIAVLGRRRFQCSRHFVDQRRDFKIL